MRRPFVFGMRERAGSGGQKRLKQLKIRAVAAVLGRVEPFEPSKIRKVQRSAMISFSERAVVPANVLVRFLEQESVLLNLDTERYFGLDAVGTRMWQVATSSPSLEAALLQLAEEYDAPQETLRTDLANLVEHLLENGLIAISPADVGTASPV